MMDLERLLGALRDASVQFVIVGGVAAGRPRDLETIAELETIREESGG